MNCPICKTGMVMVKAPFMKDDYPYCRTCKKELVEIEAVVRMASQEVDSTELEKIGLEATLTLPSFRVGDLVKAKTAMPPFVEVGYLYWIKKIDKVFNLWVAELEGVTGHVPINYLEGIGKKAILP